MTTNFILPEVKAVRKGRPAVGDSGMSYSTPKQHWCLRIQRTKAPYCLVIPIRAVISENLCSNGTIFQWTLRQNPIQKIDNTSALVQVVTEGWETHEQLFSKSTSIKNTLWKQLGKEWYTGRTNVFTKGTLFCISSRSWINGWLSPTAQWCSVESLGWSQKAWIPNWALDIPRTTIALFHLSHIHLVLL